VTVICTDGLLIASDGRTARGWELIADDTKKIFVRQETIFAVAGLNGLTDALIDWWLAGHDPKDLPICGKGDNDSWDMIVINRDGQFLITNRTPYPVRFVAPFAIGSGCVEARAAMKMGADPRRAVEIAISMDLGCGGTIRVVNIREALGFQPTLKLVAGE
jgi:hypothetical protein